MFEISDILYEDIEIIRDLWEMNRRYHENSSEYFKELYSSIRFEERIKVFKGFKEENVKITVAKNDGEYIAYCISTIIEGKGEIESLHVNESIRRNGIGKKLAAKHLEWMNEKNCKVIGVTVSQENESAIGFYRSLGLYPNTLYMQQR